MGYQSGPRASSGRARGFDRPSKAKAKKLKTQHSATPRVGEGKTMTLKEVSDRVLAGLENLGAQTFATPPYHQHYERWLKSLEGVLDDFEASHTVEADKEYEKVRSELYSAVEAALKAKQEVETARSTKILGIHGSKDALLQAEREHDGVIRELASRRDAGLKPLIEKIESLRGELEETQALKAGLLERITKSKAKLEQEAADRLAETEKALEDAKTAFAEEQKSLQTDYESKRREILDRVAAEKKQVEALEAEAENDGSVEVRRVSCEELALAVKALVKRNKEAAKKKEEESTSVS
jgi:hypothetical protein